MSSVVTCDSCAAGVCNGDWTHLDFYHNNTERDDDGMTEADHEFARISATLEVLGWLSLDGDADMPGYFTCGVCDGIQCSGGTRFNQEN